jgi:hypothetical protein
MSTKNETAQTPEAVAYKLMCDLLGADGKLVTYNQNKTDKDAANRNEIAEAYKQARMLVIAGKDAT